MTNLNNQSMERRRRVGLGFRSWLGEQCRQMAARLDPTRAPACSEPAWEPRPGSSQEETLAFSRKLIEAQDQERSRIARELHEDINQRLAMLAVEVGTFQQNPPSLASEISDRLFQIRERIIEASKEVQSISRQLQSNYLEHLGIVASMRSFCQECAARHLVEIEFSHDQIPRAVSQEISLCLFRIMQEALSNAVKHSNAMHFNVNLGYSEGQLSLTITDHGTGFNVKKAMHNGGLGLISMRERARIVNGTIAIESRLLGGTVVAVSVPLESHQPVQHPAG